MKTKHIEFTRINNDVNGNPRYVCHFLALLSDAEQKAAYNQSDWKANRYGVDIAYEMAIKKAKQIGGRKFHNKQYGGGIVFQSYNIRQTEQDILNLLNK